jgi:glycine cleavage system H lipoate-binding protein
METRAKRESMKIVPPGKKKCVWMEAGVVSYKLCDNNYDCSTCVYDQGMQLKVARQKEAAQLATVEASTDKFTETWVDKMMQLPASQRKCRYMITGEIGRKICPNSYECGNCSFDQMMQERLLAETLPVHSQIQVAGYKLAEDTYYHEGHTWAKTEYGGRVRVGLDDTFQVLSPINGIVTHINDQLSDNPGIVNESPYEKGWLFIVEPTKLRKNLKSLHYGEEAYKYMTEERERLFAMANDDLKIAADGGVSVEDIFAELDMENRARFVKAFLRT